MIRCAILDDEPRAISIIEEYVQKLDFLELLATFRDPTEAISFLNESEVQLLFLDINMPDVTGLQLPGLLEVPPLVIFTTAYSKHALESYDLDVVDYLLKPIEFPRFLKAVNRARLRLEAKAIHSVNFINIKSGPKLHRVGVHDILYLEKDGHYISFKTKSHSILSRMNMAEALNMLPEEMFVQTHRSFAVSISHISVIENHQVQIEERKIPIGPTYKEGLSQKLKN